MRRLTLLLVLALSGCALVAFGCSTRKPEEPVVGPEPPAPSFVLPESTLVTLVRAIHDRSITNFGLVLADTLLEGREFHSTYDPADLIEWQTQGHPAYIVDWRKTDEMTL